MSSHCLASLAHGAAADTLRRHSPARTVDANAAPAHPYRSFAGAGFTDEMKDVLLLEQQAAVRVVRALLEAEAAHAEGIGLEGVGKSVAHKLVRRFTAGAASCALIEEERVEDRSAGVAGQMVLASRVEEPGAARVVRTTGPTVRVDHQLGDVSLARSWRTLVVATRRRLGFAEAM